MMGKRHGTQAGDPAKGARAFWEVAQMEKPPVRMAIGSDCYKMILQKLDAQKELVKEHEKLSNSTDVDGYKPPS